MKELICYLLARAGGNDKPSKDDVKNILASVGIEADEAKLDALFADLEGLDVDAAIKEGMEQLAIIPTGGGGGGGGAGGAADGGAAPAAAAEPEAEESSSEKSSEAAGGLFGDDDSSDDDSSSD